MTPPLYGLDIETDTSVDGLDPAVARVVAVAVSGIDGADTVVTGPEAQLLSALDTLLAEAEPGVIITWNGAAFDLPFLATRARTHGIELGLHLELDLTIDQRHPPLAGHPGPYRARWHDHDHLDAYLAFRATSDPEASGSLKTVAASEGFTPVTVDVTMLHLASATTMHNYVASDAAMARQVAKRRWPAFRRLTDGQSQEARQPRRASG